MKVSPPYVQPQIWKASIFAPSSLNYDLVAEQGIYRERLSRADSP